MSGWHGSNRRAELPPNWRTEIRPAVLKRDGYRCRWITDGERCPARATDVDHMRDRHDHSLANLQALCGWHHARKSAAEGGTAAALTPRGTRRPTEPHPGSL